MKKLDRPKVSIGFAVFNGEKTIHKALNSILSQTFRDFELIISDNASSDSTEKICEMYKLKDNRIKYIRQNKNIGAAANYKYVLNQAKGEYFMWAAADDWHSDDFLELNVAALDSNSDYSASTSPNCFEGDEKNLEKHIRFNLNFSLSERYVKFLKNAWKSHGIFYSLMRRKNIEFCEEVGGSYAANDWSINFFLLSKGRINRTKKGLVVFGKDGRSFNSNPWSNFRSKRIEALIPIYEFSKYALSLMRILKISNWLKVFYELFKLNIDAIKSNIRLSIKLRLKK